MLRGTFEAIAAGYGTKVIVPKRNVSKAIIIFGVQDV